MRKILLIDTFIKLEKLPKTISENFIAGAFDSNRIKILLPDKIDFISITKNLLNSKEKPEANVIEFVTAVKGTYDYIIWHIGGCQKASDYSNFKKFIQTIDDSIITKIVFVSEQGWPKLENIKVMLDDKTSTTDNSLTSLWTYIIDKILSKENAENKLKILNEKQISMISGTIILPTIIDCYGISKCDEKKRNDYLKEAFGTDNIEKCKTKIEEVLKGYIDFKDIKGKNNIKELCDAVVEAYKNMNLEKKTE